MSTPGSGEVTWDISVPLLNNRLMIGALVKIFGFSVLVVAGLLSLVFASQGDWALIPQVWLGLSVIGAGLIGLGLFVMGVVLRNRMRCRFTVSDSGVRFETIDTTLRAANRAAVVVGVLLRRPQAVGAGLIAQSQEVQALSWRGSFRAHYAPNRHVVTFSNRWRSLMIVYCTPDNYADVAARIQACLALNGTEQRVPARSPLPRSLGYTALVVLASVPVFLLSEPFNLPLWLPLLLLCFSLAAVWLIGIFGYVVLLTIVMVMGAVLLDAFSTRTSFIHPGESYPRWSVISGDGWATLALSGIGLSVLAWMALQGVRGRINALLSEDMTDSGE